MVCGFLLVCVRIIERVLKKEEGQERIGVPDNTRERRPGSDSLVIIFQNLFRV
jgi:hypothetical protein